MTLRTYRTYKEKIKVIERSDITLVPGLERQVRHFSDTKISTKESKSPIPLEVKVKVDTARKNRNFVPTVKSEVLVITIPRLYKEQDYNCSSHKPDIQTM